MSSLLALLGAESEQLAANVQQEYENEVSQLALPSLRLPIREIDVVHVAPWLFADVSRNVSDPARTDISISALLYRDYLLAFDAPIDGDVSVDALHLLAAGQWHERALTRLHRAVPSSSTMWMTLAKLARRQIAAVVDERTLRACANSGRAYSFDEFAMLAAAKSAVLVAVPAACSAAQGREDMVDAWDAVLDPFSIALQLRDDLTDWRADWNAGAATYAHVRALESGGLLDAYGRGEHFDAETIGHHLFHGGVASELLTEALDALDASADAARELGAHDWARFTQHVHAISAKMARKVDERRAKASVTASPTHQATNVRDAVQKLVHVLESEHDRGYTEASHRMQYARQGSDVFVRPGDAPANGVHEGAVFHRAIIGWFYALAARAGVPVQERVVEENLDTLITMRVPGEILWSYHPTIAGLPPDIDDLAQILLAFLGNRTNRDLGALFDRPASIALDTQQPDGAIETWVIDPSISDGWKEWYTKQIAEYWGPGAEAEVVANLATALFEWKPAEYREPVVSAARYVASQQSLHGSWSSTWYVGPYYGTFVATRLLQSQASYVETADAALVRARQFLLSTQRADGGWGVADRSDPMSTAFATLALSALMMHDADDVTRVAVARATRWLMLAQRADGLWFATSDFICFDLHRQAPEFGERFRFFRSTTITSTYAGAALLAAERWLTSD